MEEEQTLDFYYLVKISSKTATPPLMVDKHGKPTIQLQFDTPDCEIMALPRFEGERSERFYKSWKDRPPARPFDV